MDSKRFNQQHREQQRQAKERQDRLKEQLRRDQDRMARQRRDDEDRRRRQRRQEELNRSIRNQQQARAQRWRPVEPRGKVGRTAVALPARLVLTIAAANGSRVVVEVPVGDSVIGRSHSADIKLPEETVSSEHAQIRWNGKRAWIRDLDSTNGTTLRDRRVTGWAEVRTGDALRLGATEISVSIQASGQAVVDRTLVNDAFQVRRTPRSDRRWWDSPVAIISLIVGILGLGVSAVQLDPERFGFEVGPLDVVREIIPERFGGSGEAAFPDFTDVELSPPSDLKIVRQEGCEVWLEWVSPTDKTGIVRYEVLVDGGTGGFTTNPDATSAHITIFSGSTRQIEVISAGWGFNQSTPSNARETSCERFGPDQP